MSQSGNWWAESGNPAPSAYLTFYDANGDPNTITFSVVESEEWTEDAEVTEHPVEVGANIADHVRVALVKCSLKIFTTNEPITQASTSSSIAVPVTPTRGPLSLDVPAPTWSKSSLTLVYPVWDNPIQERALLQAAAGTIGGAAGGTVGGVIGSAAGGLLGALLLSAHASTAAQSTTAGLENVNANPPGLTLDVDQWAGQTDYVNLMHQLLIQLKNSPPATGITLCGTKNTLNPMVIDSLAFSRNPETGSGERCTISFKEIRMVSTQTVPVPIPNLSGGGGTPPVNHGGQDPAPAEASVAIIGLTKAAALIPGATALLASAGITPP